MGKRFIRHARAKIANGNSIQRAGTLQAHLDASALGRIADRVANDVLDRAAQQFGIALHLRFADVEIERDLVAFGLDANVVDDHPNQFVQPHRLRREACRDRPPRASPESIRPPAC